MFQYVHFSGFVNKLTLLIFAGLQGDARRELQYTEEYKNIM